MSTVNTQDSEWEGEPFLVYQKVHLTFDLLLSVSAGASKCWLCTV